ncbi:hypothetical protein [Nonomuraea cavernae]|uniref:hypothetical protein n=1 Tax=Nonomuraea cavernae TaxID=2045107 RepID=UPI0034032BF3
MVVKELHGPHVARAQEGHEVIDWSDPVPRCESVRVRSHTCECLVTVYELCAAGGLVHIRRTVRASGGNRVSESPWLRAAEGNRLWESLLAGGAR